MGIEIKCEIGGNQNFVLVDNFKEKKRKKRGGSVNWFKTNLNFINSENASASEIITKHFFLKCSIT